MTSIVKKKYGWELILDRTEKLPEVCMKKVAVIIPVSPHENPEVILSSAREIKSLDYTDFAVKILYSMDVDGEDERARILQKEGVDVLTRKSRGKRAGAINDALQYLRDFNPDYVAIFDVDSSPQKNFIQECVKALENDKRAYMASSRRYISNPINFVSRTIEVEYYLMNFLLKGSAFKQFNGLIGVHRAEFLYQNELNEKVITEDADYATRMHAKGYRAILVFNTKNHEQSPVTWADLFNQRKRWYYGGLQLWRYREDVRKSESKRFVLSWTAAMVFTYIIILFLPFILLSPFVLVYYSRKLSRRVHFSVIVGLALHVVLLQYSALVALSNFITRKDVEWKAM
ncbi:MAG: glycosyltransferase [Archaeoglobaceae archaeon]